MTPEDFTPTTDLFDWPVLRENLIDDTVIRSIVADFIRDADRQIQALAAAADQGHWEDVARLAHTFKGACATLAARHHLAAAQQIEQEAGRQDPARVRQVLGRLRRLQERAREQGLDQP